MNSGEAHGSIMSYKNAVLVMLSQGKNQIWWNWEFKMTVVKL